jgi:hypothetical protein
MRTFSGGLCKGSPLPHHFSETFLDDYEIMELAKVSLFGPASSFFRKLFSELTVQEE